MALAKGLQVLDVVQARRVAAARKAVHVLEVLALRGEPGKGVAGQAQAGRWVLIHLAVPQQACRQGRAGRRNQASKWLLTHLAVLEQLLAGLVDAALLGGVRVDAVVLARALQAGGQGRGGRAG